MAILGILAITVLLILGHFNILVITVLLITQNVKLIFICTTKVKIELLTCWWDDNRSCG